LTLFGVGVPASNDRWSSSEIDATTAHRLSFETGAWGSGNKIGDDITIRPIRAFTSTTIYAVRDTGPSGGRIFYKNGDDYLECSPIDMTPITFAKWSNVALLVGTATAIGTGQANTTAIISQVGHTTSAAKLCNDLTSDMLWTADTTGAMCYYDNDSATYKADYGALYNWYAVDNAHGLAPAGWRVPTETDILTLIAYIGELTGGGKLKEIGLTHWSTPNAGATDEYGFKAVGAGLRLYNTGLFSSLNTNAAFYGSTGGGSGYYMEIVTSDDSIGSTTMDKTWGFSVRMMRDV
jgi:uncharacterized protein (TIGR02145 family)